MALFSGFDFGGGTTVSVAWGKCNSKEGDKSGSEQDGDHCKREGIDMEWPSGRLVSLGREAAYRRLTRPWQTRVREKRRLPTSSETLRHV